MNRNAHIAGAFCLIDKLKTAGEECSARARESVEEAPLRRELAQAYGELGRAAFVLIEQGALADATLAAAGERIRGLERRLTPLELRR